MQKDIATINWLKYLVRTYDSLNKSNAASKNRLQALIPDAPAKYNEIISKVDNVKGQYERLIKKQLEFWDIWNLWLKKVPGAGAVSVGHLILYYYYKSIPICTTCGADLIKDKDETNNKKTYLCSACGKKTKGDGILMYRIEFRDFPTISKWWYFMGLGNGKPGTEWEGRMPKRKKGTSLDWKPAGRTLCYLIGINFVKQNPEYKRFYDLRKAHREQTHPDASKGHRDNMARHEMMKLFLSHFWQVARTMEGLPVTKPYVHTVMGHTGFIDPFYWDPV